MGNTLVIDILITATDIKDDSAVHDLGGGQLLVHNTDTIR